MRKLGAAAKKIKLRLYVAGNAPNSVMAIANIKAICTEHFNGVHELEIIDMLAHPARGLADRIIVTPTLVRLSPSPIQLVIGNLSNAVQVLQTLGGK